MSDILMPALSPTMEEGVLAKWHIKVGDSVVAGQVIAEIETDKATMEVEAVDEGVIEALLIAEGSQGVAVNTPIARFGDADPLVSSEPAAATAPAVVAAPTEPVRASSAPGEGPRATPLARRLAQAAGLALESVSPTGPHGRIVTRDVSKALGLSSAAVPAIVAPPRAAQALAPIERPPLKALGVKPGSYDLIPLDGMRRTIARRMSDSFRDVPHFPLTVDIEIDALLALRAELNRRLEVDGDKASLNDMIVKAAAVALRRVPEANASFTPDGIALHHDIDIAVAVAIDGGLITPIIRRADGKGVGEISREAKGLAERARARTLAPEEFQGGTFSVSNLGMFGIRSFSSIVNAPQGAILSVGLGDKRPVVKDDALAIATVMTVTLTCDHRAMDGAVAARWVKTFKEIVEQPLWMLL